MNFFNIKSVTLVLVLINTCSALPMYKLTNRKELIESWGIDGQLYSMLADTEHPMDLAKVEDLLKQGAGTNTIYRTQVLPDAELMPLHIAARLNPTAVPLLIDKGANVTLVDSDKATALHYAALGLTHDHVVAAIALLKAGALVNAKDKFQSTPLTYAEFGYPRQVAKNVALIELLKKVGGELNFKI